MPSWLTEVFQCIFQLRSPYQLSNPSAVVQTTDQGFDFNGESDLDLQYSMSLTNPQNVTLLQTGDLVEGDLVVYSP